MKTIIFSALLLTLAITGSNAQQVSGHAPWTKEDSAAINALALYPDSIRLEIFKACEYPAIIVNVASLQKTSSEDFANQINTLPKTGQEDIYNLSRYPGLISKLADESKKTSADFETVLKDYPSEIHDIAMKYALNNHDVLKNINDLQTFTNQQFQQILSYYPADVQKTFTNLLQLPEVMSLLNDHLYLTVRVGDHFKRDPEWVMHKSDSTALAEARINAEQLKDWKETLQQDTSAQRELKEAASAYADSNGYSSSQVAAPADSNTVNNYTVYPYYYWFGYPAWYPYEYWYPYPYWYDWGFYYGPYGGMIVFGFPSFYFLNWYFYHPYYWRRYPHLGSAYIHHYYGHDRSNTMSRQVVHNWVQENRKYLPAGFTKNDANRPEVMKQLGELNEKAINKSGRIDPQARDQYYTKNSALFSKLNDRPDQPKVEEERVNPDLKQEYTKQPPVAPQRTQPANNVRPQNNYNNLQKAQQYHNSGWQNVPSRSGGGGYHGGGGGGGGSHGGGGGRR